MGSTKTFKLEELAAAASVSPRTVRYYVQRGLLAAPQFRGRDTVYDEEHLLRLLAIRRLQDQYLPLDAIQAELARLSPSQLDELVRGAPRPAPASPLPAPRPPAPPAGERWTRWELAPGIELMASERAAVDDELVDALKRIVERQAAAGGRGR